MFKAILFTAGFLGLYAAAGWVADHTPWQLELVGFLAMVAGAMVGIYKLLAKVL